MQWTMETISVLPSCMHAVKNDPSSMASGEYLPTKNNLWQQEVFFAVLQQAEEELETDSPVCPLIPFQ